MPCPAGLCVVLNNLDDGRPMNVADELLLSVKYPNGVNSYTLTTRLGQMLREAEARYGPRDQSFTILGVEFFVNGPLIWFPDDPKHVVVQLAAPSLAEPQRAYYQLAQEIVHLLDPCVGMANNLEEGIATDFAAFVLNKHF